MQRRPQARSQEVQIGKCKLVFKNNLEILSTFFFFHVKTQEEQVWYSENNPSTTLRL